MNHKGTLNIQTKRLLLRRFEKKDAEYIYRNWASDPEVSKHLTWPVHTDVKTSKKVLDMWLDSYDSPSTYNWAIVYKEIGQPIGSISVVNQYDESSKCEIGYCLGRKFWKRGVMTEALSAVMDYLFNDIGYNRIQAYHHVDNPASGRVMVKVGMKEEGHMKQFAVNNKNEFVDVVFYGIVREDFNDI
jgi:ribosomal-protein-alanine N-acetyltransferase